VQGSRRETYAAALDMARRDFAARDPAQAAREAGGSFDPARSTLFLDYLGVRYGVHYPSGRVFVASSPDRPAAEVPTVIMLHYLVKTRGATPSGRWISFRELPGGDVYMPAFNRRAVIWLLRRFGQAPERLLEAALRLGGTRLDLGDVGATLDVLPLLPVAFVLWRGDDEVPAGGNVLFDATAPLHLDTEDLAAVAGEALAALSRA